jgi:hypothetical protein
MLNSYKLETLNGIPLQGEFSARQIRAFTPRTGTQLAKDQEAYENGTRRESVNEENEEESRREEQQEQEENGEENDERDDEADDEDIRTEERAE